MTLFFRSLLALRHLRMHLAHEGLTARERYGYLMVWAIWITMASVTAVSLTEPTKVVLYAIAVWGVWWAYTRNGGPDGHALLDRYFSVGMIVTLRVTVALLVIVQGLAVLSALGSQVFTASAYLQYFLAQAGPQDEGGQVGIEAVQELVMMAAELYVAWAIGRELGKIREAAGDAHALAPVASMTSLPPSTPAGGYGGWTARPPSPSVAPETRHAPAVPPTTRPLDRFVERVVQSELAAKSAKRGATPARVKAPARPKRRSAVRLIRAGKPGRR